MSEQNESRLLKQFDERAVNRMRNIITKKHGNATGVQIGYTKAEEDHSEGDVWEEGGKSWTINDGIKMSNTKLDDIKKAMMMPLLCPNCGGAMRTDYDKKMYPLHKICFSCVIKMETELRRTGQYEAYANKIVTGNLVSFIGEAKEFINDFVQVTDDIYTEQGEKEEMDGASNKQALAKEWLQQLDTLEHNIITKANI